MARCVCFIICLGFNNTHSDGATIDFTLKNSTKKQGSHFYCRSVKKTLHFHVFSIANIVSCEHKLY